MRARASAFVVSLMVLSASLGLSACSSTPATGTIRGILQGVGGLPGAPSAPYGGTVVLAGHPGTFVAKVSQSGRFTIDVPAGNYRITGHSPSFVDGLRACSGQDLSVASGRTVEAVVSCERR